MGNTETKPAPKELTPKGKYQNKSLFKLCYFAYKKTNLILH